MAGRPGVVSKFSLKFSFDVTIFSVVASLAIALSLTYVLWESRRDEVAFVAAVVAGGAALYSAYYNGFRVRSEAERRNAALERERAELSDQRAELKRQRETGRTPSAHFLRSLADENDQGVA